MTKIDIISGFLGAGKTTFIKKLLKGAFSTEKVVLIENEFGEIGIDGGFLKEASIQVTEMNSGCICCSLVGDFEEALKQVEEQYHPDRIIIEPSGVGKLSDVIQAVRSVQNTKMELNSFVTIVDGSKCKMFMRNFGEFYNDQVSHAKVIVLSRTQKLEQAELEASVTLLKEINPNAVVITTPWELIGGMQILATMEAQKGFVEQLLAEQSCPNCEQDHHHDHDEHCACGHDHHHSHDEHCACGHDHHHHHADEVFTSWGIETPHRYTKETIEKCLKELSESDQYGMILRAKGMVEDINGEWMYFDMVPGEYEVRNGSPEVTGRICVIGSKLKKQAIQSLFQVG